METLAARTPGRVSLLITVRASCQPTALGKCGVPVPSESVQVLALPWYQTWCFDTAATNDGKREKRVGGGSLQTEPLKLPATHSGTFPLGHLARGSSRDSVHIVWLYSPYFVLQQMALLQPWRDGDEFLSLGFPRRPRPVAHFAGFITIGPGWEDSLRAGLSGCSTTVHVLVSQASYRSQLSRLSRARGPWITSSYAAYLSKVLVAQEPEPTRGPT